MTLNELYAKLPVSKHKNVKVIGDQVVYDTGTTIHVALIDDEGQLIPTTQAAKVALGAL